MCGYCISLFLVNELEKLHHKFATRPDVFGDSEGEHEIEILTGEITQVYILCSCMNIATIFEL